MEAKKKGDKDKMNNLPECCYDYRFDANEVYFEEEEEGEEE